MVVRPVGVSRADEPPGRLLLGGLRPPGHVLGPWLVFFFQAEDGIRDRDVTGVQTCALPILQGSGLLGESIKLPGVACAGAADLYDGRHTLAREIAGATLPVTRRYQQLLDDKTIDCIVAAVPDQDRKSVV